MAGLRRYIRFLLLLVIGGLLCMFASYALVRYVTRNITMVHTVDPLELRVARELRTAANQLTTFANQYFEQLPVNAAYPPKPAVEDWVDLQYLEALGGFLASIRPEAVGILLPETTAQPCWPNFVAATERLHSLALHPRDIAVREVVAHDILYTVEALEHQIEGLAVTQGLDIPLVSPDFSHEELI